MTLKKADLLTVFLILSSMSGLVSNPSFIQWLTDLSTKPWPYKVQALFELLGAVSALVVARMTSSSPQTQQVEVTVSPAAPVAPVAVAPPVVKP